MEITEVRIKLMECPQERLLGFCSITIDRAFVVRDLKIIQGSKGAFVAMPSRKLTDRCNGCGAKNMLRAYFCSQCGVALSENRSVKMSDGRAKLYADIAHPINSDCRELIQQSVLTAYDAELILAKRPGYMSRYDDFGEFDIDQGECEPWSEQDAPLERRHEQRRFDAPHPAPSQGPHPPNGCARSAVNFGLTDEFGDGVFEAS